MSLAHPTSFTYQINPTQLERLREVCAEQEFEMEPLDYGHFRGKRGKVSVLAYESGKLVVQGKEAAHFVEFTLEPRVLGEARLGYEEVHAPEMFQPHLGIDESGKGDLFGPLVIAGAYVDRELAHTLLGMGVKDSKQITSDDKALKLAEGIRDLLQHRCKTLVLRPPKYNELYRRFQNLNRMLAWGHATVIEELLSAVPDCRYVLSDQFANPAVLQKALKERGRGVELRQRTKAESDIAVAAASLLARGAFLEEMRTLGRSLGMTTLPKGASAQTKAIAQRLHDERGAEALGQVSKQHFRTYLEVCGLPVPEREPYRGGHRS